MRRFAEHMAKLMIATAVSAAMVASSPAGAEEEPPFPVHEQSLRDVVHEDLSAVASGEGDTAEHALAAMIHGAQALAGLEPSVAEDDECLTDRHDWVNGGDITGDGFDDVIEYTLTENFCEWTFSASAAAVAGAEGTELWRRQWGQSFYDNFAVLVPAGDLDGVPGDDLIEIVLEPGEGPVFNDWTLTYRGLTGLSGAVLWTRTYRNPWTTAYSGPTRAHVDVDFAVPLAVADATGDGVVDVLVGRYNIAFVEDLASGAEEGSAAVVFEVVSGATGLPAATFPATGRGFRAFPDADFTPAGDGVAVAMTSVASREDGDFDVDVTGMPGVGGGALWSQRVILPQSPGIRGAELDGDTNGDVVLRAFDDRGPTQGADTYTVALFGSGAAQWTAFTPQGVATPVPVPDANGDGGQDLLLLNHPIDKDWTYEVSLLSGGRGEQLWWRPGQYATLAGDATADGATDVLIYDQRRDEATNEWMVISDVVSGVDGSVAWTHTVTLSDGSYLLATEGDANANGTEDLALIRRRPFSSRGYTLVEGADGSPLWSQPRFGELWRLTPVHIDGAGEDFLETAFGSGTLHAVSGETGATLWER